MKQKHTIEIESAITHQWERIATVTCKGTACLIAQALTAWTRRPHRTVSTDGKYVELFYGQIPNIETPIQIHG